MIRTVIIYLLITGSVRLMGKRQLGELQPSELVSTILISNLASIPIESPDIPLLSGIVPVLLLVALEVLVSAGCASSRRMETMLSGRSLILIQNGVIDQAVLRQLRFSADDLFCALRLQQVFSLQEVVLCIAETNGSISIYADEQKKPTQPQLPVLLSGRYDNAALAACGVTAAQAERQLAKRGFAAGQVLVMLCDKAQNWQIICKEEQP